MVGSLLREYQYLTRQLQENVNTIKQVQIFIEQLASPFGFVVQKAQRLEAVVVREDMEEETAQYAQIHKKEKDVEKKFDNVIEQLAKRTGRNFSSNDLQWLDVMQWVCMIQLALCALTMFARPSFLTATISTIGLYCTNFPKDVNFNEFRLLTLLILASWVYDAFWLLLINSKSSEDE